MGFGRGIGFSPVAPAPVVPELEFYLACWHNRHLYSSHGTWSICRNGYSPIKTGDYQRPNSKLYVTTSLVATYHIYRAYLSFNTQGIPAEATVTVAKLGLYVITIPNYNFPLLITKGLWDEPVVAADFGLQTDEVTVLGSLDTSEMVVGQYNWIDLNAAGIAWINQRSVEINQHESYDWGKNIEFFVFASSWLSQSFTPQTTHTLTKVKVRIRKVGTAPTLHADIYLADANHCPTGSSLASASVDPSLIPTPAWGDWVELDFGAGAALTAGTEYCLVLHQVGGNTSNCTKWIGATGDKYPNGMMCASGDAGGSYDQYADYDLYFIDYESAQVGGTKFCLRTAPDVGDSPPGAGAIYAIQFHSAQKAEGGAPLLAVVLAE